MVLVIDTAGDRAFIGLWDLEWKSKNEFIAGRELNSLIIKKLEESFLYSQEYQNDLIDENSRLKGIIVNAGPGSFTGLRIGLAVANTIAYTKDIPIVGVVGETEIEKLCQEGRKVLKSRGASFEGPIVPHYGAEPHITQPKKG